MKSLAKDPPGTRGETAIKHSNTQKKDHNNAPASNKRGHENKSTPRKKTKRSTETESPNSIATTSTVSTTASYNPLHEILQRQDARLLRHETNLQLALNETKKLRMDIASLILSQTHRSSTVRRRRSVEQRLDDVKPEATCSMNKDDDDTSKHTTTMTSCVPVQSRKVRRASQARKFLASLTGKKKKKSNMPAGGIAPTRTTSTTPERRSGIADRDHQDDEVSDASSHTLDEEAFQKTAVPTDAQVYEAARSNRSADQRSIRPPRKTTRYKNDDDENGTKDASVANADQHKMMPDSVRNARRKAVAPSNPAPPAIRNDTTDSNHASKDSAEKAAKDSAETTKEISRQSILPGWLSNASSKRFMEEMDEASRLIPNIQGWKTTRTPRAKPRNNDEPGYAYQETVRCKESRAGLPCQDCYQCQRFYKVLQDTGHDIIVDDAGRHRNRFAPAETPEDFWELDFIDELKEKRKQNGL